MNILNSSCENTDSLLNLPRLWDKLIGKFLESDSPALILMNHPLLMCSLAKPSKSNQLLADRFEVFINGMEIINAYNELNDPQIQRNNFMQQLRVIILFYFLFRIQAKKFWR